MTFGLVRTFKTTNPRFAYNEQSNPRRVLTKPSERADNQGYDNKDHDYILYVHDIISSPRGANRYQVLDLLGKGTFGQVVKCLDLERNEFVAIKIVKNLPAFHSQGLVEVKLLQTLNSKYDSDVYPMVRMLDNFIFRNHLCLIFELLNVSLYELIRQNQFRGLSVQLVSIFTKQILTAMVALHQTRIIHCDLKPENILLEDATSPNLKVIDFGSACFDNQAVYTYIQSRFYRSPEVILGLPYKLSIDVWSLGCIVFELFVGLPLFPGLSQHRMLMRFIKFLGMPPYRMLAEAKDTSKFFNRTGYSGTSSDYVLKTDDEYSRHIAALTGNKPIIAQPFREYYKAGTIQQIVLGYEFKSGLSREQKEEELAMRRAMLSFLEYVLPWDPEERWTPEQLLTHPFITGEPCPDGRLARPAKEVCDQFNPLLQAQAIGAERALVASSTMVVAGSLVPLPQTPGGTAVTGTAAAAAAVLANVAAAAASSSSQSQGSSSSMPQSPMSGATPNNSNTANRMDDSTISSGTPSSFGVSGGAMLSSEQHSRASSSSSHNNSNSSSSSTPSVSSFSGQQTGIMGSFSENTTPASATGSGSAQPRSSSFPASSTTAASSVSMGINSTESTPASSMMVQTSGTNSPGGSSTLSQTGSSASGTRAHIQHPGQHQAQNIASSTGSTSLQPSNRPTTGSSSSSSTSSGSSSSSAMLLQSPSSGQQHSIPSMALGASLGISASRNISSGVSGIGSSGGVPITPAKAGKVPSLPGLGTSPSSASSFLSYMSGQSPMMGKLGISPRDLQQQYQSSQAAASSTSGHLMMNVDDSPPHMSGSHQAAEGENSTRSSSSTSASSNNISSPAHTMIELSQHTALDSYGMPATASSGSGKRGRAKTGNSSSPTAASLASASGTYASGTSSSDPFSVFDSPINSPGLTGSSKRQKYAGADSSPSPSNVGSAAGRRHSNAGGTHHMQHQGQAASHGSAQFGIASHASSAASPRYNANATDDSAHTMMDVMTPVRYHGGTPEHVFPSSTNNPGKTSAGGNQVQTAKFAGTEMVVDYNYMGSTGHHHHQSQHQNQHHHHQHSSQKSSLFPSSSFAGQTQQSGSSSNNSSATLTSSAGASGTGFGTSSVQHAQSDSMLPLIVGDLEDNLTFWDGQERLEDYGSGSNAMQVQQSQMPLDFQQRHTRGGFSATHQQFGPSSNASATRGTTSGASGAHGSAGPNHFSAALAGGAQQHSYGSQQSSQMHQQQGSSYSSAPSSGHLPYGSAPGSTGSLAEYHGGNASNSLQVPTGGMNTSGGTNNMGLGGASGAAFGLGISPYESSMYAHAGGANPGAHFFSGSFSSMSSSFAQPTLGSSFSSGGNTNLWDSAYSSSMEQPSAFSGMSSSYDQPSNPSSYAYGGSGSQGSYSALQGGGGGLPTLSSSFLVSPSSSDSNSYMKRAAQQQQQQYQQQMQQQQQQGIMGAPQNSPPSSRTFRRRQDSIP